MSAPGPGPDPYTIAWGIERKGRRWRPGEAHDRYHLSPEKIEMYQHKLFWSDHDRLNMLALLLENVGADAAVRFGDPAVWRAAVAALGVGAPKANSDAQP